MLAALRNPGIDPQDQDEVVHTLNKLLTQFVREGAVQAAQCSVEADGHAIVIAWDGDLSGCRKDKIAKTVQHIETKYAQTILNAPPMLINAVHGWQAVDRQGMRNLVESGEIVADSTVWPAVAANLGALRVSPTVMAGSYLAPVFQRYTAN